jgi:hypothetical protein
MLFGLRARRCGTLQTFSDSDGLTRKLISDCIVYAVTIILKRGVWAPSSRLALVCRGRMAAAAFGRRVMLSSLLADFVSLCLPGPQQRLYRCQADVGGRVMARRDYYGRWQMFLRLL